MQLAKTAFVVVCLFVSTSYATPDAPEQLDLNTELVVADSDMVKSADDSAASFPYTAFVDGHGASVLSGPDKKFYSTDRLEWGTKVEVYRHDGDFAAIRPPAGSFSWIPVDAVEATEDVELVSVSDSSVYTRIGSQFNDEHAAEYIRLKEDELLEVLGQQKLAEPPGVARQSWYKVAPPAGEFRWVRMSSLSSTPPTKVTRSKARSKPMMLESETVKVAEESPSDSIETIESEPVASEPVASESQLADAFQLETESSEEPAPKGVAQVEPIGTGVWRATDSDGGAAPAEPSSTKSNIALATYEDSVPGQDGYLQSSGMAVFPAQRTRPTSDGAEITTITSIEGESSDSTGKVSTPSNPIQRHIADPISTSDGMGTSRNVAAQATDWNSSSRQPSLGYGPDLAAKYRQSSPWREVGESGRGPRIASAQIGSRSRISTTTSGQSQRFGSQNYGALSRSSTVPSLAGPLLPSTGAPLSQIPGALANPTPIYTGTADRSFLMEELADINLELTTEVAQPPEFWSLDELQGRAQAVIDASNVASVRDQAQRLLARVAQFQDVQRRGASMARGVTKVDNATLMAKLPRTGAGSMPGLSPSVGTRNFMAQSGMGNRTATYDGAGWLMPVVTAKRGLPRYVLTDDRGSVLQFVTPQPGLNLKSYVRKKIGIYGNKSYLPSFERPHLLAERIVSLNQVR